MHFTVSKSSLLKELQLVQGVVKRKAKIPVLSYVLIEAGNGALSVRGTDLDVSLVSQCDADVRKAGAACLSSRALFQVIRSLPGQEVEFKQEKEQVVLRCEGVRFKLPKLDKDSFPEIASYDGVYTSVPADVLRVFIARTAFAITAEESRYTLNGARVELNSEHIRMIATDGHRLSFIEKLSDFGDINLDFILRRKALAELAKLVAKTDGPVGIACTDGHVFLRVGRRVLVSRALSGKFPNYEQVFPKENNIRLSLPGAALRRTVNRIALMSDRRSNVIRLEMKPGSLTVVAPPSEFGEADELIATEYDGKDFSVALNAGYLSDALAVMNGDNAAIEFKDGNTQVQMRIASDDDYDWRYIVMPMRL